MEKVFKIKLYSYDHVLVDEAVKLIKTLASESKSELKGPIPLPTHRELFTICRSPHVDKPSMEQFERLTHKRLIFINCHDSKFLDSLKTTHFPSAVRMEIKHV